MRVRPKRDAKCAGEAEVRQLEIIILVDEQVLRLKVLMEDPM